MTVEVQTLADGEATNRELIASVLLRLSKVGPSREKSLAVTKLQEALLWLGIRLEDLP